MNVSGRLTVRNAAEEPIVTHVGFLDLFSNARAAW